MATRDGDPDAPLTLVVGVIGVILLFVLIVGLQTLFYVAQRAEERRKVVAVAPEELRSLEASQLTILEEYRWVDRGKGIVGIPIDRAMELLVRREAAKPAPAAAPPAPVSRSR